MTKYRVRVAPQDGRPHIESIEADSMEEAVAYTKTHGLSVDAIEAVEGPGQFEPATPLPPSAPRAMPPGVFGPSEGPFALIFGAMFTMIPVLFVVVGLSILIIGGQIFGLFFALFPMIHLTIGVSVLKHVITSRRKRNHLYVNGIAATGTIDRAHKRNIRVNRRRVYEIEWTFYVHDKPFHGKRSAFDREILKFQEGDLIWVLYDPSDPAKSVEWPPLA